MQASTKNPVGISIILVFVFVLLPSRPALSQGELELAESHFKAATSYYNQGKYDKALEEFKETYRLMPDPAIIYNIAQCYERMGMLVESVEHYRKYMNEKPDATDLQAVKDKVAILEKKLDETGIYLSISEEGAKIFVDEKDAGTSPINELMKVSPGSHELKVVKEGFQPFLMKFSVAAGLSQSATINLNPLLEKEETVEEDLQPIAEAPSGKGKTGGYIATYTVSGLVLAGGGVAGVLALVYVNKANNAYEKNDLENGDRFEKRARNVALVCDVMVPAGVMGLIATSIVLGIRKPWKEKRRATLRPIYSENFGGVLLEGSF